MFELSKSRLELCPLEATQKTFAEGNEETRAAIFTRQAVVDFILDLVGYTSTEKPVSYTHLTLPTILLV